MMSRYTCNKILYNGMEGVLYYIILQLFLASNIDLVLLGRYVIAKDPHFDPFCVWGNEIFMNQHQVRKLIKIVIKIGQNMSIELFVYTLCKTKVNCGMVSKNPVAFFLLPVMSCVR